MNSLELWGGVECTVNRVGDSFGDQLVATGLESRLHYLDRLADLGITALRFPILWERVSPEPGTADWDWSDAGLERLRARGVRPIAGLVHHGSGPRHTSLIDESFAPGLAEHALAVAQRYPWIEEWTPVNEPLTTARFSALYGHWYPHARDEGSFWLALLTQIDAVRLSMKAIRSVVPGARLIQTDDLGRTYATASLRNQAWFDNTRRWMGWDLLCGKVTPEHPFWGRLCGYGYEDRLRAIADDPCPPDVIGINHYLTSDRFLDHRVKLYPPEARGGNQRQSYADVAAIRVLDPPPEGFGGALSEAWERYGIPLALTEVHNGCTREEQLRWLVHGWRAAESAREAGIDVRAVTPWALFGSKGWDTLLTGEGRFEYGAFDTSAPEPRQTRLATTIADLATGRELHPATQGRGWWERGIRFEHAPAGRPTPLPNHPVARRNEGASAAPLLILGATGTLGQAMAAACRQRGLAHVLVGRDEIDISAPQTIPAALARHRPWAVINTAGWVRVDDAEENSDACHAVNTIGAFALASACAEVGLPTLNFSSDLVFDGVKAEPYLESDRPAPLGVYGQSKAELERALADLPGDHLVIRTAAFFSPHDQANFAYHCTRALQAGEPFVAASDCTISPTYVPDLCDAALDLLIDGERGVWHLSNETALTWLEFAHEVGGALGLDRGLITGRSQEDMGWRAPRPPTCALGSERGSLMPSFDSAIGRFAAGMRQAA